MLPLFYTTITMDNIDYVVQALLAVLKPQCTHVQLSPFYHLSTLDVTHMKKDTRPSVFFMQPKMVRAWEQA